MNRSTDTPPPSGRRAPAGEQRTARVRIFVLAAGIGALAALLVSSLAATRRRSRATASAPRQTRTPSAATVVELHEHKAPVTPLPAPTPELTPEYGWVHWRAQDSWTVGATEQDASPEFPELPQPIAEPVAEPAPVLELVPEPADVPAPAEVEPEVVEPVAEPDERPAAAATPPAKTTERRRSMKTTKRVLTLMMLAGIAVYFGGGGVFGSFSAETTNAGSSATSGTLTMSDQVNTNTACISNDLTNGTNNVNKLCSAVVSVTNLAPGVFASLGTATVTVQDTGSIAASKLWLWAPPNSTTLTGALTSGSPVTTLSVAALPAAVTSGQSIVVSNGANTQTFVASAGASLGATSISVTSQNANFSYPATTSAVNVVDCLDAKTTVPGIVGATKGTDLNFNATAGNPFCGTALIYVQEITGTVSGTPGNQNYCWVGANYGDSSGMCKAPISVNLSSPLSTGGAITSLPVAALNGNVRTSDSIVVTSGTNTQTFTASANAYIGATSIPVTSLTPNFAYPTTSTVTDSSTLGSLNSDTTDTIKNFDTLHNGAQGPIELKTVTSNGTLQASGVTTELGTGSGAARVFQVGVYFPQPAGQNQNSLQGLASTFGLTWHIDQ